MNNPNFKKGEYITCPNHKTPGIVCFEQVRLYLSSSRPVSEPDKIVHGSCWGDGSDDDMTCHQNFYYTVKEADKLVLKQWKEDEERQTLSDQRDEAMKEARCCTPCPSCGNPCWEIPEEKRKKVLEKYPYPKRS